MMQRYIMTSPWQVETTHIPEFTDTVVPSNLNKTVGFVYHAVDITFYVLSIALFGISCYVFLVLCIYLHRFLQKRRHSPIPTTSSVMANGFGKIALSMRFVAAAISLLCILNFVFQQILLHSSCCDAQMSQLRLFIYGSVILLSYLFFWLRQRVLYDAPAMKLFNGRLFRALSWLSLALVIINSTAQITLACFLYAFPNPTWAYLSWLLGCIMVQGTLMSLFLYPLLKHGKERKAVLFHNGRKRKSRTLGPNETNGVANGIRDSNIFTVSSSRGAKGSRPSVKRSTLASANPMYRAARRCVVCASVAFVSDLVAGIFNIISYYHFKTHEAEVFQMFLFDFNLVVNSVFVVGCFANWRRILLPKCFRPNTRKEHYLPPVNAAEASLRQRVFANHYINGEW